MSDTNRKISRRRFLGAGVAGSAVLAASQSPAAVAQPSSQPILQGLISAVFTPFRPDGKLNLGLVPEYVDRLIASGMEGFYVTGSTGEGVSLSVDERKATAEAFVKATQGRVPVTVQIGANSLEDCRTLAAHAEAIGVDALSASAPSYFTVGDEDTLVDFMGRIALVAPKTPFYYYHIPARAKVAIPDMCRFLALAESRIPNLVGIKYTESTTGPFQDILHYGSGKFEALWGSDEMLLAGLASGAKGGIGTSYALAPGVYHNIVASFRKGDLTSAELWQYRSWSWIKALIRTGSLLSACRSIYRKDGFDLGDSRLPLNPLSPAKETALFQELEQIGFYDWRNG